MKIILIGTILFLLFFIVYIIRSHKIMKKQSRYNERNEIEIQAGILEWCNSSSKTKHFTRDELFSPAKMKNGEISSTGLEITVNDYTKNVPWIIRK